MRDLLAAAVAATAAFSAPASAFGIGATLTFDDISCNGGQACADYQAIDQSYGDSRFLDVQTNRDVTNPAYTTGADGSSVFFWDRDYNDLTDVAWGNSGGTPMVFLKPADGYHVTLLGLDLGAYPEAANGSQLTIVDGTGATLFSSGPIVVGAGNVHSHFSFDLTSTTGIGIQWGPDGYNVGLDNVSFQVSDDPLAPVPEPGEWAMLGLGLAVAGTVARRRR